jgi:hypothetical protein
MSSDLLWCLKIRNRYRLVCGVSLLPFSVCSVFLFVSLLITSKFVYARSENSGCNQSFFLSVNDVTTLLLHPSGCASQCSGSIKFTWAAF